ncbi:hypothetical protein A7985_23785 [Pseudoalteromonas luteoviolacea]|uniref:Uncharacterized protein n=1 Tax=Pseudoalteromonas luteoviolacea TaxID=43657 RepID=A0A1C0TJT2_9GAMM|nr:hypothetical protein A7985_23785 [Pseudoalteromonas luteoviolacea]
MQENLQFLQKVVDLFISFPFHRRQDNVFGSTKLLSFFGSKVFSNFGVFLSTECSLRKCNLVIAGPNNKTTR